MITSIVLTDCHNIKMNSNKKFKVGEQLLSVEKDIPFVRYRFKGYTDKEFNYIKETMKKFNRSTHLIEIELNLNTKSILDYLTVNIPNAAKYIYINITDEEVLNGELGETCQSLIEDLRGFKIDRYVLKDNSTTLDMVAYKKITKSLKPFGIAETDIGVCSSPLSFGDLACLTAVKARELMSTYSEVADVALPSANHQCMNCCGCIRYLVVDKDTEEVADKKSGVKKSSNKTTSEKTKKNKENSETKKTGKSKTKTKVAFQFGQYSL